MSKAIRRTHAALIRLQDGETALYTRQVLSGYGKLFSDYRDWTKLAGNMSELRTGTAGILKLNALDMSDIVRKNSARIMRIMLKKQTEVLGLTKFEIATINRGITKESIRLGKLAAENLLSRTSNILAAANDIAKSTGRKAAAKYARERLLGDMGKRRAANIAQSEGHAAANDLIMSVAKSLDGLVKKMWMSRRDDKVRSTHREADGQTVKVNSNFKVGAAKLAYPGDPKASAKETINCRCFINIIRKRKSA